MFIELTAEMPTNGTNNTYPICINTDNITSIKPRSPLDGRKSSCIIEFEKGNFINVVNDYNKVTNLIEKACMLVN